MESSVISLISYDAHLLPASIRSYYNYVDQIVLGLDSNRISWSGNEFSFDENLLWQELDSIDGDDKILVVEDNFHKSDVPMENDNYERNFLKHHCKYQWVLSFDADEELVNANDFFYNFVPLLGSQVQKRDLLFHWFLPYKYLPETDEYLVIAKNDGSIFSGDTQGFATHKNNTFTYARWTNNRSFIQTPLCIKHWSFCRNEHEVNQKINNFGHSDRTKDDPFFDTWKQIDGSNYEQLRNFKTSGFGENQWERLIKIPANNLDSWMKEQAKKVY